MSFLPFCLISGGFSAMLSGILFQFLIRGNIDDSHVPKWNVWGRKSVHVYSLERFDLISYAVYVSPINGNLKPI